MDAFGAYAASSIHNPDGGIILLNVEGTFAAAIHHDLNFKNLLVETLTHEIAHAVEDSLGLEFDEDRVERIVNSYREKAEAAGLWEKEEIQNAAHLPTPEDIKRWYSLLVGQGESAMYDNMIGFDRAKEKSMPQN